MQTYYEELGISSSATADEIHAAFRRVAKQYHPDLNAGREQQSMSLFVRAQKAFEVLSNPELRSRYDALMVVVDDQQNHWGSPAPTQAVSDIQPLQEFQIEKSSLEPAIDLPPVRRPLLDDDLRRVLYYVIGFVVLAFLIVLLAS
jgi:curved DNA-binding protein CbpA